MNVTSTQSCVRMAASIHMVVTGATVKLALSLTPTSHVKVSPLAVILWTDHFLTNCT